MKQDPSRVTFFLKRAMNLKTALKSLPVRSFKQQSISGCFWFRSWHSKLIVSTISDITRNVFCPDEHPKSATLTDSGKSRFVNISFVFLTNTGLVIDKTLLWNTQRMRKKSRYCLGFGAGDYKYVLRLSACSPNVIL